MSIGAASHNGSAMTALDRQLIELKGVSKSYVGVSVLRSVDFSLKPGEVLMLCGENGAGKSTIKNILSGLIKPDAGEIRFNGKSFSAFSPDDVERLGIGTIHQELSLFANLSVAENIHLPRLPTKRALIDRRAMHARSEHLLGTILGADIDPAQEVTFLSLGQRQLVEIAKAIHRASSLLILDEPTTCLSIPERRKLFEVVRRLCEKGYGIIYITHFLEEVYALADRIVVLRDGVVTASGTVGEIHSQALTRAMVGRSLAEAQVEPKKLPAIAPTMLRIKDVGDGVAVKNISFDVARGEILGIAGLMGAGRSELVEVLTGIRPGEGSVWIEGEPFQNRSPQAAIDRGMVLVSEDRRRDQAFLIRPVRENLTASSLREIATRFTGLLKHQLERKRAGDAIETYDVQPARQEATMVSLSGGNQQRAIVGRWLSHNPRICILDEPTKGVDVGARATIHELIIKLAAQGTSFIVISSDMPELLMLCHRAVVLHKGRLVGTLDRCDFEADKILTMASTGGPQ